MKLKNKQHDDFVNELKSEGYTGEYEFDGMETVIVTNDQGKNEVFTVRVIKKALTFKLGMN